MEIIKPKWNWRYPPETDPLYKENIIGIALHHMDHPTADIWEVERWHLERDNGTWKGFGYNWWVGFDGKVYEGRGWNQGAGVANMNHKVISVGFQGAYHPREGAFNKVMPEAQYKAGVELIAWLVSQLPNKNVIIDGHKRWNNTECPGQYFPLQQMVRDVQLRLASSWKYEGIDKLAEAGIIDSPDYWKERVDEPMPVWAVTLIAHRIYKKLKG